MNSRSLGTPIQPVIPYLSDYGYIIYTPLAQLQLHLRSLEQGWLISLTLISKPSCVVE